MVTVLRAGALRWRAASAAYPPGRAPRTNRCGPLKRRAAARQPCGAVVMVLSLSVFSRLSNRPNGLKRGTCERDVGDHMYAGLRPHARRYAMALGPWCGGIPPATRVAQIRRAARDVGEHARHHKHVQRSAGTQTDRRGRGKREPGLRVPGCLAPPLRCGGNRRKALGVASGLVRCRSPYPRSVYAAYRAVGRLSRRGCETARSRPMSRPAPQRSALILNGGHQPSSQ